MLLEKISLLSGASISTSLAMPAGKSQHGEGSPLTLPRTAGVESQRRGGGVARPAQGDAHFAAAFFDFRLRNGIGRVVRDGRAHDGSVGSVESRGGGVVHLGGREHVRTPDSGGRRQGRGAPLPAAGRRAGPRPFFLRLDRKIEKFLETPCQTAPLI